MSSSAELGQVEHAAGRSNLRGCFRGGELHLESEKGRFLRFITLPNGDCADYAMLSIRSDVPPVTNGGT